MVQNEYKYGQYNAIKFHVYHLSYINQSFIKK